MASQSPSNTTPAEHGGSSKVMSVDVHADDCNGCCNPPDEIQKEEAAQLQLDRTERFLSDPNTNPVERILAGIPPQDRLILGQLVSSRPQSRPSQGPRGIEKVALPIRCRPSGQRKTSRMARD